MTIEKKKDLRNNEYFSKECYDRLNEYFNKQYNDYLIEKAAMYFNRQYEDAEVFVYKDKSWIALKTNDAETRICKILQFLGELKSEKYGLYI